ncbi:MAG: zinc-ribbon domain-containing protein [Actinomycetales bacterium]
MIVLFGTRLYREVLGVATMVCPRCGQIAAQRVERRRTKFTLFFIPLIPLSTSYRVQCAACAVETTVDEQEAHRLVSAR